MRSSPIVFAYLDEPPFCFPAEGGTAQGSDVELATAALAALGVTSFERQLTTFAELLPGLVDGRWTITTPLFINSERLERVDFSLPVWSLADGLLTRSSDRTWLTSYETLARDAHARLVVVSEQVQEQTGLDAGIPDARVIRVGTQEEAVQMVTSGRAEAYASVAMAHRGYLARYPEAELAVVDVEASAPARGAFAFAKSELALRQRFDGALRDLLGSAWHRSLMARYGFTPESVS